MNPAEVLPFADRRRSSRVWLAVLCAFLLVGPSMGCGDDDEGAPDLSISVSPRTIAADGSDLAVVTVLASVGGAPAPDGSAVTVFAEGVDGGPGASFTSTGERQETGPTTGGVGRATFELACEGEGEVQVVALFDGVRREMADRIRCQDRSPGSSLIRLTAQPQLMGTQSTSVITASAETVSGAPMPEGTAVRFEITSGNVEFQGGGNARARFTAANGRTQVTVSGRGEETNANICATFTDEAIAGPPVCIRLVVTDEPPDGALCQVSFSQLRAPANGEEVTQMDFFLVNQAAAAISGARIDVSVQAGTLLTGPNGTSLGEATELTTDEEGRSLVFIRSSTEAGAAGTVATASWTANGVDETTECIVEEDLFFFARPLCTFEGMSPSVLGVAESGRNESGSLRFCFADAAGTPVRQGERVEFAISTGIGDARLNSQSSVTGADGCAGVEVFSGTQAGQIEVQATYPFGQTATVCSSNALSILGARPTANGWTLECTPDNAGAMVTVPTSLDAADIRDQGVSVTCSTILRDRFGNPVTFPGTEVFFHSEQGTIQSPRSPDSNGRVTTVYNPNGVRPRTVAPISGEPRVVTDDGTNRVVNPRDMLVTIVAWTQGEEAFLDGNGNGRYDEGEIFFDLGEPLFDYNDNDQYDPQSPLNEGFIDVQTPTRPRNGVYDGPSGAWEGDTVIWTQSRVTLSGRPVFRSLDAPNLFNNDPNISFPSIHSGIVDAATLQPVGGDGISRIEISSGQSREFALHLRDLWLNPVNTTTAVSYSLADCGSDIQITPGPAPSLSFAIRFARRQVGYTQEGLPAEAGDTVASYQFRTLLENVGQPWSQEFRLRRTGSTPIPGDCRLNLGISVGGGSGSAVTRTIAVPVREPGF